MKKILMFVIMIAVIGGALLFVLSKYGNDDTKKAINDKSRDIQYTFALGLIEKAFPDYKSYTDKADQSVEYKNDNNTRYFAFVKKSTDGSIQAAKCFVVDLQSKVKDIGTYVQTGSTTKSIDPQTCKPE